MVCKGLAADTQTKFYCVSIKKKTGIRITCVDEYICMSFA